MTVLLLNEGMVNEEEGRIVNVSSAAHESGYIDPESLLSDDLSAFQKDFEKKSFYERYAASKLANIYFTYGLKQKLEESDKKIITCSLHPGVS